MVLAHPAILQNASSALRTCAFSARRAEAQFGQLHSNPGFLSTKLRVPQIQGFAPPSSVGTSVVGSTLPEMRSSSIRGPPPNLPGPQKFPSRDGSEVRTKWKEELGERINLVSGVRNKRTYSLS